MQRETMKQEKKTCKFCGDEFIGYGNQKYCSKKCTTRAGWERFNLRFKQGNRKLWESQLRRKGDSELSRQNYFLGEIAWQLKRLADQADYGNNNNGDKYDHCGIKKNERSEEKLNNP